jgi:PAS domain S-box-containing protein
MARNIPLKSDVGRMIVVGAVLMIAAYLLDSIINASLSGVDVGSEILSPGSREIAVRLAFLSVLLLFIVYTADLMIKRRRLEEALVKYQAGMDASSDGIFILDGRSECTYVNGSLARLYQYGTFSELLGKSWGLFFADDELRRFDEAIFPVVFEKGEWRGEAVGRRRDGTLFPQEISISTVDGEGIVCIVRDITAQKSIERELESKAEELADANRELEAFSYSLSHDMRTYLTRISSAAQMLQHDQAAALDETGRYLVNVVSDANKEMQELIDDLMVLSGIVRSEIRREDVNLSQLAGVIAASLQMTEVAGRVEFVVDPDLTARCDPRLMRVVLENLLGNAWKYTGTVAAPRVEFGVTVCRGERAFCVRDNGIGFGMDEAGNLFKPFQRLQNAKEFAGTGVGLATVYRIIQRHGGKVWGEGERGKGAAFFFTLPE